MDGNMFDGLILFIRWLFIVALISVGALIILTFNYFSKDYNVYESKDKPVITWKLEAHNQKVDTVWIYKFKK